MPGIVLDWVAVTPVARAFRAVSKSFRAHASTWARASLTARESGVCDMTVSPVNAARLRCRANTHHGRAGSRVALGAVSQTPGRERDGGAGRPNGPHNF